MTPADTSVSAVVCAINAEATIERCLRSLRANGVGQVILVDGSSTDRTVAIAREYADVVLTDPGVGLGTARNIGIAHASGSLVLNCGADNALPPGSLDAMIEAKVNGGYTGVGAVTLVAGHGYLSWASRHHKLARFTPGERAVIGTPTLFDTATLRKHPFDNGAAYSDDSELCERLTRETRARFAIADVKVDEITPTTVASIVARYKMYGASDYETDQRGRSEWSMRRRIRSLTHPVRVDFVEPLGSIRFPLALPLLPFLSLITVVRYWGWVRYASTHRRTSPAEPRT